MCVCVGGGRGGQWGRLDGFLSFRPHTPSATETASARLSASLGRSQLAGGVAAICSINSISRRWTKAASCSGWVASQLLGATLRVRGGRRCKQDDGGRTAIVTYHREERSSSVTRRPIRQDNIYARRCESACVTVRVLQQQEITAERENREESLP